MAENRLNIIKEIAPQDSFSEKTSGSSRASRLRERQAKFERLWLNDPQRFDPLRNCMERERLERTWQLLTTHTPLILKQTLDIGCATGVFSRRLRDGGAQVEAVDIAENALKRFKEIDAERIHLTQGAMPTTPLPDHGYDVIICTELIAEIPREDYRLFFAELSRLVKSDGYVVCSSPIDIDRMGGIERLIELAQTEFNLLDEVKSYHALYLRLKRFFEAPSQFIEAWRTHDFKQKQLAMRRGFNRAWFWINTLPPFVWMWMIVEPCTRPLRKLLKNNTKLLLHLEKICRFIWDQEGVSHYLFIAKRRSLKSMDLKEIPVEKPRRKEIWD